MLRSMLSGYTQQSFYNFFHSIIAGIASLRDGYKRKMGRFSIIRGPPNFEPACSFSPTHVYLDHPGPTTPPTLNTGESQHIHESFRPAPWARSTFRDFLSPLAVPLCPLIETPSSVWEPALTQQQAQPIVNFQEFCEPVSTTLGD